MQANPYSLHVYHSGSSLPQGQLEELATKLPSGAAGFCGQLVVEILIQTLECKEDLPEHSPLSYRKRTHAIN